jgi:hypothetical protein
MVDKQQVNELIGQNRLEQLSRVAVNGFVPEVASSELKSLVLELQQRRNQDAQLSVEEAVLTANAAMLDIDDDEMTLAGAAPLRTRRDEDGTVWFEDGTTVSFTEGLDENEIEAGGRWFVSCLDFITGESQVLAGFAGRVVSGFVSAREAAMFASGFVVGRRKNPGIPSHSPV